MDWGATLINPKWFQFSPSKRKDYHAHISPGWPDFLCFNLVPPKGRIITYFNYKGKRKNCGFNLVPPKGRIITLLRENDTIVPIVSI